MVKRCTYKSEIFRHETSQIILSIIFLEDKHKHLLHLSIFYEYQQFFQHLICFSIQPPDKERYRNWPCVSYKWNGVQLCKYFSICNMFLTPIFRQLLVAVQIMLVDNMKYVFRKTVVTTHVYLGNILQIEKYLHNWTPFHLYDTHGQFLYLSLQMATILVSLWHVVVIEW
jgi:hypothetical protein